MVREGGRGQTCPLGADGRRAGGRRGRPGKLTRPTVAAERADGRAIYREPLTAAQQALAATAAEWLWQEVNRAPQWLVRSHGRDGIEQEAWVAVCKAAHDFDPVKRPGVPFGAFARIGVRRHLMGVRERTGIKLGVWQAPPLDRGGEPFIDPADHRTAECDPALRAWCSPDYAAQRRCLDWRARLILYLRFVEGWTLDEVGGALGLSRERVRQLEERAGRKLAAFRDRTLIRRQLRGNQT